MEIAKLEPRKSTEVVIWQSTPRERYYTESAFWVALKRALQRAGHDVVKKCPVKDGHVSGDKWTFYLRTRKPRSKRALRKAVSFYIYDPEYAIEFLHSRFNATVAEGKTFTLPIVWDIWIEENGS